MIKKCPGCGETFPLEEFGKRGGARGNQPQPRCRECNRKYQKEWYYKNRKSRLQGRTKQRETNRQFIFNYLKSHPCADCGETNPVVLEFDHMHSKKLAVSQMIKGYGLKSVQEEITKCEVRCGNCHREKTAKEQNAYMWQLYQQHQANL